MTSLETRVHELTDENAALSRIITQLKAALREERLFTAQTELEYRIRELPEESRERLRKAFPNVHLAGLREAINVESKLTKQDARVAKILGGSNGKS